MFILREKIMKSIVILFFIFASTILWAEENDADNNYWQCHAEDSKQTNWIVKNKYKLVASNKALEECKKESEKPLSCGVNDDDCNYISANDDDEQTKPNNKNELWKCTALDKNSEEWDNVPNNSRDEAAINAKINCQNQSKDSDSCYINLLTCKNINEN